MGCQRVTVDGVAAIVCGPDRRCRCGRKADRLCDWKDAGKKSGTCDTPLCAKCATSPAPEKDLCPRHAAEWASHPKNNFSGKIG